MEADGKREDYIIQNGGAQFLEFDMSACQGNAFEAFMLQNVSFCTPKPKFDGCMSCGFFQWCDEGSSDEGSNSSTPMSPYPTCSCGAGKCRLVMKAGRKAFVCHIKKGQGACDFFQFQDSLVSLVKEDDLIDGRSNESPQPVSDNDERVGHQLPIGELSLYAKQEECNGGDGHQLPIGELSLYAKQEECNGGDGHISNLENKAGCPSLPQKRLHINEANPCLRLDKLDLNEEVEEGDDDWMQGLVFFGYINEGEGDNNEPEIDGLFVYGSIEESTSSGTEFRVKVGNPLKRLEKEHEQEEEILFWPVKKRRASSSSEQLEVGAERPSASRRLDFDDERIGGDHNGLANSPLIAPRDKGKALLSAVTPDLQECGSGAFNVPRDKGKALLSDEGFQAEVGPHKGKALLSDEGFQAEVGPHSNIRMPDLHECQDDVDLAVEQLSFGTWAEKVPVSTSSEVFPLVRLGHHPCKQDDFKGSEIASFNLSSKNDPVSSYGERFQAAEVGRHPVVIEVEDSDFDWDAEDDKAFEDIVLSVNMKKGLVSSFGEGFQGKVGHHPSTEEQNLHGGEAGNGSDVEWIDLTEGEGGDSIDLTEGEGGDNVNRPDCQPSSGKGSQSEVGCHGKATGVENADGLEMSLQTSSNEKSLPPLNGKGSEEGKMHGTEGRANVSCLVPQARKYFQSGKAEDWMKVFSNSQICFKCGKSGHSKEDCNR
ncbi:hypothetical protein ACLOJK_040983 [Asimina triloba]